MRVKNSFWDVSENTKSRYVKCRYITQKNISFTIVAEGRDWE